MATFRPTKRSTPTSPIQRLRRSLSSASDDEPTEPAVSAAATAGSDASASTDDEKAVLSHWDSDNALDATDLPSTLLLHPSQQPPTLFLDVDGVLNTAQMFERHALHPKLLRRLKAVVDETDARIVLSTTWRMCEENERVLIDALIDQGMNPNVVVGRTPVLGLADLHWSGDHGTLAETRRASEVVRYLDTSPAVEKGRWAVVDDLDVLRVDDPSIRQRLEGHFIRTAVESGLTQTCCDALIALLKPLPPPPCAEPSAPPADACRGPPTSPTFNMKLLSTTGTVIT